MTTKLKDYAIEMQFLKEQREAISKRENAIKAEVLKIYEVTINRELQLKDEPYGAVSIYDGEATLKVTVPKKVSWDQEKLRGIVQDIAQSGGNVTDYVDIEYNVPELKYKSWPGDIKDAFIAARTIEPGTPSVKIDVKGE